MQFVCLPMMHLFFDASAASSGSGPTYVRNVVPHLRAREDIRSTILISPKLRREFHDGPNISFVSFTEGPVGAAARFVTAQRIIPKLIRHSEADVLVSTGNMALFRAPIPQILLSGNALYTSESFYEDVLQRRHYSLWLDTKLKGLLAKWSVRTAEITVAPSEAFAAEIRHWTGVPAVAIHHGFDRDLFFGETTPLPSELRTTLNRTHPELRVLYVSHYNYYRNFEMLIRAVAELRGCIADKEVKLFLTCRLVEGENPGSYRPAAAAALVHALGMKRNLVELGSIPYHLLHHVYRACDVYVTPSYVETFAHPLVEAMASGVPVIASDLPVHREVCKDAALYFSKYSDTDLAEAICKVARDPALVERMSRQGLLRSAQFSWKAHVGSLVSTADELRRKMRT
jgi:glycosyltransferase involved in cell wall biosynthesis